MPRLTDPHRIRRLLETDRPWSLYALGDLAPELFARCEWFAPSQGDSALLLLYRAFETPVLFTLGSPDRVAPLLDEITAVRLYLHVRPEILPLVRARYAVVEAQWMWRMMFDASRFQAVHRPDVARLAMSDVPALERLYADGDARGEAPDFFAPEMIEQGLFYGVREGSELIAAAGTHLLVPAESVAAVGNIYTRRDQRGRGWATHVTSAVTEALLGLGLRTVGLNVQQPNAAAIRVYERLGYVRYCEFVEGLAGQCR
jgi:ribosomal protein S18 acetylase RimI-like enzyme